MNPKLYIGNLSPTVTETDLRLLFSRAGTVTHVQLMLDPATSKSRGFAYVTMATSDLAAAALRDFHCFNLGGRFITLTEARPPQEPTGRMSEGFSMRDSAAFRLDTHRKKTRGRSPRRSPSRSRNY